ASPAMSKDPLTRVSGTGAALRTGCRPVVCAHSAPSPDRERDPGSVRIAAGGGAGDLRPAVDIDGVAVVAAAHAAALVIGAGNDSAVAAGLAPPAGRLARLAVFERLHFGRSGALAVALVETGADRNAGGPRGGRARRWA